MVSGSAQSASDGPGTVHEPGLAVGSHGRSAPCAPSLRAVGERPARLLAARGAENMGVLREQIIECLPQVRGLRNSCLLRQFSQLGDRLRGVVAGHLRLITFRFRDQAHALLFANTYV